MAFIRLEAGSRRTSHQVVALFGVVTVGVGAVTVGVGAAGMGVAGIVIVL